MVQPITGDEENAGILTETFWAALHGLVTLMRSGRRPEEAHETRLARLVDHFSAK